jgi:hypothetical protein
MFRLHQDQIGGKNLTHKIRLPLPEWAKVENEFQGTHVSLGVPSRSGALVL